MTWPIILGAVLFILVLLVMLFFIFGSTGDVGDLKKNTVTFSQKYCDDLPLLLKEQGQFATHNIDKKSDTDCLQYAQDHNIKCKDNKCTTQDFYVYQTKDYFDDRTFCCVYKIGDKAPENVNTGSNEKQSTLSPCNNYNTLTKGSKCSCNGKEYTCPDTKTGVCKPEDWKAYCGYS